PLGIQAVELHSVILGRGDAVGQAGGAPVDGDLRGELGVRALADRLPDRDLSVVVVDHEPTLADLTDAGGDGRGGGRVGGVCGEVDSRLEVERLGAVGLTWLERDVDVFVQRLAAGDVGRQLDVEAARRGRGVRDRDRVVVAPRAVQGL